MSTTAENVEDQAQDDGSYTSEISTDLENEHDHQENSVGSPSANAQANSVANFEFVSFQDKDDAFHKIFQLPPEEHVVEDFSCAYYKKILLHGRMYISPNYVCFYSNIFGFSTRIVVEIKEISQIEKKSTALFLPNALEIFTKNNQTHFFGSLLFRDQTYNILTELWKIHLRRRSNSISSNHSFSNINLDHNNQNSNSHDLETDRATSTYSDSDDDSLQLSDNHQEENNTVQPTGELNSSSNNGNNQEGGNGTKPETDNASQSNVVDEDDNEPYDFTIDNIPSSECYHTIEELKMKEVVNQVLPASVKEIFSLLMADSSDFVEKYHTTRGEYNITIRNWSKSSQPDETTVNEFGNFAGGLGHMRVVTFTVNVKIPFGPKFTRMVERQRYIFFENKKQLVVQINAQSLDVPFAETFRVENIYQFKDIQSDSGTPSCQVRTFGGVHFIKNSIFKSKIEENASKELAAGQQGFVEMALARIREMPPRTQQPQTIVSKKPSGASTPATTVEKTKVKRRKPQTKRTTTTTTTAVKSDGNVNTISTNKTTTTTTTLPTSAPPTTFASTSTQQEANKSWLEYLMFDNISIPVWAVFLICLLVFGLFLPVQMYTLSKVSRVSTGLEIYKQKTLRFELHLKDILSSMLEQKRKFEIVLADKTSGNNTDNNDLISELNNINAAKVGSLDVDLEDDGHVKKQANLDAFNKILEEITVLKREVAEQRSKINRGGSRYSSYPHRGEVDLESELDDMYYYQMMDENLMRRGGGGSGGGYNTSSYSLWSYLGWGLLFATIVGAVVVKFVVLR